MPRLYLRPAGRRFAEDFSSVYGGGVSRLHGHRGRMRAEQLHLAAPVPVDQTNFDDEEGVRKIRIARCSPSVRCRPTGSGKAAASRRVAAGPVPGVPGSDAPVGRPHRSRALTMKFDNTAAKRPHTAQLNTALACLRFCRTQGARASSVPWRRLDRRRISKPGSQRPDAGGERLQLSSATSEVEIAAPGGSTDFRAGLALEARPDPDTKKASTCGSRRTPASPSDCCDSKPRFRDAAVKTVVRNGVPDRQDLRRLSQISFSGRPARRLRLAVGLSSDRGAFLEGQVPTIGSSGAEIRAPSLPPPGGAVVPAAIAAAEAGIDRPGRVGAHSDRQVTAFLTIHGVQLRLGLEGNLTSHLSHQRGHIIQHQAGPDISAYRWSGRGWH